MYTYAFSDVALCGAHRKTIVSNGSLTRTYLKSPCFVIPLPAFETEESITNRSYEIDSLLGVFDSGDLC